MSLKSDLLRAAKTESRYIESYELEIANLKDIRDYNKKQWNRRFNDALQYQKTPKFITNFFRKIRKTKTIAKFIDD